MDLREHPYEMQWLAPERWSFFKVCNRSIDQTLHHYPSEQYYFVYAFCSHLATFCCRRNWNRLSWQFIFAHDQNSDERPYLLACVVLLVYSFIFLVWGDFLNYHLLVYHEIPIRCLRVNKNHITAISK